MELKYIGGVYGGNIKPTPFLCLILKMLQIAPEKDIIIEFIKNENFKYVRFLGAFYMRLTGTSLDVYKYLEPLLIDYRKLKRLNRQGKFEIAYMDNMIDDLLNTERVCDIALPRIQQRHILEELNKLEIRVSPLEENLDELESSESEKEEEMKEIVVVEEEKKKSRRSRSREKKKQKYIDYDKPDEDNGKSSSPSRRHRSKSEERKHKKKSSKSHHRDESTERKHKKKHKNKKSRSRSRDDKKRDRKRSHS
jgi:pre-mRNA-splicing factor 38A